MLHRKDDISIMLFRFQMADPLTALMHAVHVMNFLRMLILKTLKERQEPSLDDAFLSNADPSDENGHTSPTFHLESSSKEATEPAVDDPAFETLRVPEEKTTEAESAESPQTSRNDTSTEAMALNSSVFFLNPTRPGGSCCEQELSANEPGTLHASSHWKKASRCNSHNPRKGRKARGQSTSRASWPSEKSKGTSTIIVSRINSKVERIEAWR